MIEFGWFRSHSGIMLPWKLDCDTLSDSDINGLARIIREKFRFGPVIGIPTGGLRLAEALSLHSEPDFPTLLVDDVLTSGESMMSTRHSIPGPSFGVVIFARTPYIPDWIWPIFRVEEWAQCRSTGLG